MQRMIIMRYAWKKSEENFTAIYLQPAFGAMTASFLGRSLTSKEEDPSKCNGITISHQDIFSQWISRYTMSPTSRKSAQSPTCTVPNLGLQMTAIPKHHIHAAFATSYRLLY